MTTLFPLPFPRAMKQILHDDCSQRPFFFCEQIYSLHHLSMYFQSVGLFEAHDQDTVMLFVAILYEALVCGDQEPFLFQGDTPKFFVGYPLKFRAPDIHNIMSEVAQLIYRHQRDIFVNEDPHATTSSGMICSSVNSAAYSIQAKISSRLREG